jgi:uncharacterized protein (TIGR02996 family)
MSAIDTVRTLVADLRRRPDDVEGRSVLGDWCEEHGFEQAARFLRDDLSNDTLIVLASLRALFGEELDGQVPIATNRSYYGAVAGLFPAGAGQNDRAREIEPGEERYFEATPQGSSRCVGSCFPRPLRPAWR